MKQSFFITGIGTDVGKTIISAIVTEALEADYWKPIQAGDLHNSDSDTVKRLITNKKTKFHPSSFQLQTPMSPHAAAEIDGVKISTKKLNRPTTKNTLIIEGAGGLLVPINNTETVADLIKKEDKVIIVSKHYLGSINHTLLTVELLKQRGLDIFGIIFNSAEHKTTEDIIARMTNVPILGRVDDEPYIDAHVISEYAEKFQKILSAL